MDASAPDGGKGKRLKQAIAITTLSPVLEGHLPKLRRAMWKVRVIPFLGRPLQELAFIYFARWTTITKLRQPDPKQPERLLNRPYLLFESNYDGSWEDYLDAFADRMPVRLSGLWGECEGFEDMVLKAPGGEDRVFAAGAFKRFVKRDEQKVLHFYGGYPYATTRAVRQALELAEPRRRPLDDDAIAQLALGPAPLHRPKLHEELAAWWRGLWRRPDPGPLTLALPLDSEQSDGVLDRLCKLKTEESPFAPVKGTHFARFVLIPQSLPHDDLAHPYLLFTSNFDGDPASYLNSIATEFDWVWRACAGYPSDGRVVDWLKSHAIDTSYFVIGYKPATVPQIQTALSARQEQADRLSRERRVGHAVGVEEIQGNVLKAYGVRFPCAAYLLMRVVPGRGSDARALLRGWSKLVAYGGAKPYELRSGDGGRARLNLAFTYQGLEALGAPEEWLEPFPQEFREGPAVRARDLGDRGESAPCHWEFGRPRSDVLIMLHATSEASRDECMRRLRADLRAAGDPLLRLHEQNAGLLRRYSADADGRGPTCGDRFNREHFGFADGCSQPAIEGVHDDFVGSGVLATEPPGSVPEGILQAWRVIKPRREWRGVRLGEFVLGYDDEDGKFEPESTSCLEPNGTFMVYRKLAQDVPEFRAHTERWAVKLGIDVAELRARIVGRWTDGTPLVLSDRPDPSISRDRSRANAFGYGRDRDGARCPQGAHVRRTNPRDDLPAGGEATMRHRMIRRGLPYGEQVEVSGPGAERGLMFICFSASIQKGFETVQKHWCDNGHALGLDAEPDYLLQQPSEEGEMIGRLTISQDPVRILPPPSRPFVTVRGTEYLFLPGRSGLNALLGRRDAPAA